MAQWEKMNAARASKHVLLRGRRVLIKLICHIFMICIKWFNFDQISCCRFITSSVKPEALAQTKHGATSGIFQISKNETVNQLFTRNEHQTYQWKLPTFDTAPCHARGAAAHICEEESARVPGETTVVSWFPETAFVFKGRKPVSYRGKETKWRSKGWALHGRLGWGEGTSGSVWSVLCRRPLRVHTRVGHQWRFNGLEDCNPPISTWMCVLVCVFQKFWSIFPPFCMATADGPLICYSQLTSGFRDVRGCRQEEHYHK